MYLFWLLSFLLIIAGLIALSVTVNDFEKKLERFCGLLEARYFSGKRPSGGESDPDAANDAPAKGQA